MTTATTTTTTTTRSTTTTRRQRASRVRGRRGGFTLVELLVVIGIIVLLASIAIPVALSARRNADRVRTQADLNTIAMALEAYKADFKDYPRPDPADPTRPILAWALVGPWQAVPLNPTTPGDGADGPGFRTQWSPANGGTGSKVWGPYLPPDKFPTEVVNGVPNPYYIADRFGTRIEYLVKMRNPKPGYSFFGVTGGGDPLVSDIATFQGPSIYDCRQASSKEVIYYFQRAFGDGMPTPTQPPTYPHNDRIDGADVQAMTDYPPFLLLSRGYTRLFSPKQDVDQGFLKTSEVTNLQKP